jgi:hypothetical protein
VTTTYNAAAAGYTNRQTLLAAVAAYRAAVGGRANLPPAKDVLARLEAREAEARRERRDDPTIVAFARIEKLWPKPPSLSTADDPFLAQLQADSEAYWGRSERPNETEPGTLTGALVEGVRFAARLEDEVEREKKVRSATEKATRAIAVLRGFVAAIDRERNAPFTDTPLDRPDITVPGELEKVSVGLHILDQLIETRAAMAAKSRLPERFGVSREAMSMGPTMEGVKLAAKRIRAATPKVPLKEIALVLKCAFGTRTRINEVVLKDLTAKPRKRKARPKPRPEG